MGSILLPPPRLRTEMLLSVRSATLRVPTWVGSRRMCGASRRVYLGSQRVARAVVMELATVRGEEGVMVEVEVGRDRRSVGVASVEAEFSERKSGGRSSGFVGWIR